MVAPENIVLLVALSVAALQAVCSSRLVLESDQRLAREHEHWTEVGEAHQDDRMGLVFALRQRNHRALERKLMQVSTPGHLSYGKHLTGKEIRALTKPSRRTRSRIRHWLAAAGVSIKSDCLSTHGAEFVECSVSVAQASSLLDITVYEYRDPQGHKALRAGSHYTVPDIVAPHLDFVGGVHRLGHDESRMELEPVEGPEQLVRTSSSSRSRRSGHAAQGLHVTPNTIRQLYGIGNEVGVGNISKNSQAVVQFLDQHYDPDDLILFMEKYGDNFQHMTGVTEEVGPNTGGGHGAGLEASLDLQYIMAVGANIPTWFWSTGGRHKGREPFLQWLQKVANSNALPQTIGVSYGDAEDTLSKAYMERVNQELQKLGLHGVSVLFSSGDHGAGCNKSTSKFRAHFPASSPYVTAVGGTTTIGVTMETGIGFSGGGFSSIFPMPSYQSTAVKAYLSSSTSLPKGSLFNKSGRAFPDVSALSKNFNIIANGYTYPVSGTSASTPTFAGLVSLLNDKLMNVFSKPPLGFLNPFLYKHGLAGLKDIVAGRGYGCNDEAGFCAQAGWDPVTGLGSPDLSKLLTAALNTGST